MAREAGIGGRSSSWKASAGLEPAAGPLAMTRIQALLLFSAGALGFLVVLLPHPASFDELGLIVIQSFAAIAGVALYFGATRVPPWLVRFNPPLSIVSTSLALYFSNDVTSAFALFYLWPAVFAFYFFSRFEAISTVLFAALNYVAVIALMGGSDESGSGAIHHLVLTAGTLAVVGGSLIGLRERVETLIARVAEAARTDPLTGLRSRRGLQEDLAGELERARLGGRNVSLLLADLDHFKRVNERFGQGAGDRVLRRVAALIQQLRRSLDVPARTGGGEFALLLPEMEKNEAYMVAEGLLRRVRETFAGERAPLTVSIGVVGYPQDATAADELLQLADEALYAAKTLGRDRAVMYSREVTSIIGGAAESTRGVASQAHLATMLSLAEALDLRDSGTARHSQTVGRLCEQMARELGLPKDRVERVRLAGILHDIGKIGVPDSILRKPGPLTDEEFVQMKRHPEVGARLLGAGELEDIRSWVIAHHERVDGRGYPAGLKGDEIPLEAAILAVGDAFEAMTADRVYRPAIGEKAARRELHACAGAQFDPRVVDAFESVLDRAGLQQLLIQE
ncbi:MAG TPA: diguanylate cyclase [Solirubrobacterales bacterium]|nr:diguanylate cyclase [Solirubrobacterales bacterium]